jgi:hypothetical protein
MQPTTDALGHTAAGGFLGIPTDGRSNLIQLTEPGVGLLAAADVTLSAALATFVGAAAPADELTQMSSTLRRLRQHLLTPVPVQIAARR